MHQFAIVIDNLKCGGCATTIAKALTALEGVAAVAIDHASNSVTVQGDPATREAVVARLAQLGYPEVGSVHGLAAGVATAKSFVSCAVGRIGGE